MPYRMTPSVRQRAIEVHYYYYYSQSQEHKVDNQPSVTFTRFFVISLSRIISEVNLIIKFLISFDVMIRSFYYMLTPNFTTSIVFN